MTEPQLVTFTMTYREAGKEEPQVEKHTLLLSDSSAGAVESWATATIDELNRQPLAPKRTLIGIHIFEERERKAI